MTIKFKSIADAPKTGEDILCRFWYPYLGGKWVYFVATANGENTRASGYALPEEFATLPKDRPTGIKA